MHSRPANILESWKEIAQFIGRDERTAMRWAKANGMPVHRVPGGKRSHVFAYQEEIQDWLNGRAEIAEGPSPFLPHDPSHGLTPSQSGAKEGEEAVSQGCDRPSGSFGADSNVPEAPEPLPAAPAARPGPDAKTASRLVLRNWKWVALLAAASGIVLLVWASSKIAAHGDIRPALRVTGLTKLTFDSRPKDHLHTDGQTLYFTETEGMHTLLMAMPASGGTPHRIDVPFPNLVLQDVSRDGKRLLVTPFEGIEFDKPLWQFSPEMGLLRRVGDIACFSARWAPDGKAIAYTRGGQLWVSNPDGGGARLLSSFQGTIDDLVWSPKGDRLRVRTAERPTGRQAFWDITPPLASSDSLPTPIQLGDKEPLAVWTWINEGTQFVYGNVSSVGISTFHVVGGVKNPWATTASPAFSLSIGQIEEVTATGPGRDVYLMASTKDRAELLHFDVESRRFHPFLPNVSAKRLSFSRDGAWMCYVDETTQSLWRSRVADRSPLRLTKPPMTVETASWSPDGKRIAFTGMLPGKQWRIYLVPRDGGEFEGVSSETFGQGAASWSPDGESIVYGKVGCEDTHTCGLRRLDVNSGTDEPIEGSEGLRTARWSYDGKYIAALDPVRHQLVVLNVKDGHWKTLADNVTGDDVNWSRDSRFIYVDSPQGEKPFIEHVCVRDGQRTVVVNLSALHALSGSMDNWFGLAPDDSVIVTRRLNSSEIYALHLAER